MTSSKYIGMDVHKESISIAVRNAAGKIVMESVVETKANMILDFIDGLRGEVHVTFEEGTWSAWLYDLLKAHVTKLVVCDPRRNALLKEGNQNDRVDAQKLAELLHNNQRRPVYHGEHGLRAQKELVRSYLTITKDLSRVMTRVKAIYRSWGIVCSGTQVYRSRRVAGENPRTWSAPAGRALLPTAGCAPVVASAGAEGSPGGEQEAPGVEATPSDSSHRADPGGRVAGHGADCAPFPHQPTVVDVQRFRHRGAQQRRSSGGERPVAAEEESDRDARTEQELQSPSEELVQGCRGFCLCLDQARPVPGVLHGFSGQRHATGNGQTDLSQKTCHHRSDRVEERSVLRRPSSETTNSLSVSDRVRSHAGNLLQRWPSGSRDTLVRERVSVFPLGAVCLGM